MSAVNPVIRLASRSPRRRELLAQIGVRFELVDVEIDERPGDDESPHALVERLARAKADAGRGHAGDGLPVLGADTVVAIDGRVLGKPDDRATALAMLERLAGREHEVWSGVALARGDDIAAEVVRTRVRMRAFGRDEMLAYWHTGEPEGKAGAYAIQGRGAVFVESIEGSYSNVVGLPLFETARLLRRFGIDVWAQAHDPAATGDPDSDP